MIPSSPLAPADYIKKVGPILDYSSTSGVGRTYRYLDTAKSKPTFMFGFGLSCECCLMHHALQHITALHPQPTARLVL
eukprot:COSAG01_NODE_3771_length_5712_cov_49.079102_6_plen_78_part_00